MPGSRSSSGVEDRVLWAYLVARALACQEAPRGMSPYRLLSLLGSEDPAEASLYLGYLAGRQGEDRRARRLASFLVEALETLRRIARSDEELRQTIEYAKAFYDAFEACRGLCPPREALEQSFLSQWYEVSRSPPLAAAHLEGLMKCVEEGGRR